LPEACEVKSTGEFLSLKLKSFQEVTLEISSFLEVLGLTERLAIFFFGVLCGDFSHAFFGLLCGDF
jgi:hypothetical protein